ncbi:MAG: HD domain-containing protein [Treponemataceae bacterium]
MDERLEKLLNFILYLDGAKNIFRQSRLIKSDRRENVAEHSWHLAIMAYLLKEYADKKIDIARVILMCLAHDIVEIYCGDTFAFDEVAVANQKMREDIAKEKVYSLLPEDFKKEFTDLFDEFQDANTPEARFARAVDSLQPILLDNANGGSNWKTHGVRAEQIYSVNEFIKGSSKKLFEVVDKIIKSHIEKGNIKE